MRATVRNRELMPQWARDAFDALVARINTVFMKEHTGDGAHTAITATSLTTTGDVTVGDDLTVATRLILTALVGTYGNAIRYSSSQIFVGIPGTSSSERFTLLDSSGNTAATITATGVVAANANLQGTYLVLTDGVTAPSTTAGQAKIFVDTADGDLKVTFGDGTTKTIVTDS